MSDDELDEGLRVLQQRLTALQEMGINVASLFAQIPAAEDMRAAGRIEEAGRLVAILQETAESLARGRVDEREAADLASRATGRYYENEQLDGYIEAAVAAAVKRETQGGGGFDAEALAAAIAAHLPPAGGGADIDDIRAALTGQFEEVKRQQTAEEQRLVDELSAVIQRQLTGSQRQQEGVEAVVRDLAASVQEELAASRRCAAEQGLDVEAIWRQLGERLDEGLAATAANLPSTEELLAGLGGYLDSRLEQFDRERTGDQLTRRLQRAVRSQLEQVRDEFEPPASPDPGDLAMGIGERLRPVLAEAIAPLLAEVRQAIMELTAAVRQREATAGGTDEGEDLAMLAAVASDVDASRHAAGGKATDEDATDEDATGEHIPDTAPSGTSPTGIDEAMEEVSAAGLLTEDEVGGPEAGSEATGSLQQSDILEDGEADVDTEADMDMEGVSEDDEDEDEDADEADPETHLTESLARATAAYERMAAVLAQQESAEEDAEEDGGRDRSAIPADAPPVGGAAAGVADPGPRNDDLRARLIELLPELLEEEEIKQQIFGIVAMEAATNPSALGELTGIRNFLRKELERFKV